MNEFQQTLNRVNNFQQTENGATGYSTSGQNLVDLNFVVPSNHKNVSSNELEKFVQALNEDTVLAVKWLFYLRDVREGLGERDSFIKLFKTLWLTDPVSAVKVVKLIPEYGRWKDVIDILAEFPSDNDLTETIYLLIKNQLKEDCVNFIEDKSVSLLAKWLPSINASGKSRKLAKRICNKLALTFENYRKVLSTLRKYLDVTEVKTCGGKWNEIDYNKVSSNANARYLNSFMRHDPERRQKYLDELSSPVSSGAVMHASNLYPHEVYAKYSGYRPIVDQGIEELWNNLKNIENVGNLLVVSDGSGSMVTKIAGSSIKAIDVSRSLGIFFSERCNGEFKDKVIEFSRNPRYIDLSNCKTLADKKNVMCQYNDCSNTDIEKVFDLLLNTAITHKIPQNELPQKILIISDMEFDFATTICCDYSYGHYDHDDVMSRYRTLFETIKNKWIHAGYTMPGIIFWNVNSRTQTIPVQANECGVTLVSGYSPNIVKMIISGEINPYESLKSILNSDRYKVIEEILS